MSNYFIHQPGKINTVFNSKTQLKGNLFFSSSVEIKGRFQGTIYSKGLLIIAKNAIIDADIYSQDIIVVGSVKGNIVCSNKLEIQENSSIVGSIYTYKVKIVDGVNFDGECYTLPKKEIQELILKKTSEKVEKKPKTTKKIVKK